VELQNSGLKWFELGWEKCVLLCMCGFVENCCIAGVENCCIAGVENCCIAGVDIIAQHELILLHSTS